MLINMRQSHGIRRFISFVPVCSLRNAIAINVRCAEVGLRGLAGLAVAFPRSLDLLVLQTMSGHESTFVARAVSPFFAMMLLTIALIMVFPGIVTWLPDALMLKRP